MLEFEFRTGRVLIDLSGCAECRTYACVKACSLYGRKVLRVQGGKPALSVSSSDEVKRLCIECLACEQECEDKGNKVLKIVLPIPGLDEALRR